MSTLQAIILAIIEGITEFLPISSTGHMIIASSFMGIASDEFTKIFTVCIQFGAILSVIALYYKKFLKSVDFYLKLFVAFIPAAVIGKLLNDYIDQLLESVVTVGITMFLGGIILLFVDKWFKDSNDTKEQEISFLSAFKIGLFQTIAMVPGVSRSAASIIGGLTQKLNRKNAAEFSFFLAVPTMFAATVYKLYKFMKAGSGFGEGQITLLVLGNVIAFVVALIAIKSFIAFLTQNGFKVFGYYRIIIGLIILVLYFSGYQLSIF
jgi:undecaprenyl-diphosphatase